MVQKDNHWHTMGIILACYVVGNVIFLAAIALYDYAMPSPQRGFDEVTCGDYSPLGGESCE
jgi:hypothetical protein